MKMAMYGELAPWYRLIDPPAHHAEEAAAYADAFARAVTPRPETLLELGSGAGHNAVHLKRRFRCTLSDVAPAMLDLSRELNPECEHVAGDMRTLRLGRTFDAVLVHDAVVYMTSRDDLRAAAATAFLHTRPGGAAIFAPDYVTETFAEQTELLSEDDGARSVRAVDWVWDPDPADEIYSAEYAFVLRDGSEVRTVADHHVEGLFPRATWIAILGEAGYRVELMRRPIGDGAHDEVFLARRPA